MIKTYDIASMTTFAIGLSVVAGAEVFFYLLDIMGGAGLYVLAGGLGVITLGILGYLQCKKQTDYIGHRWLNGSWLLSWASSSLLFVGSECLMLHALDFSAAFFWPIGLTLSAIGCLGFLILAGLKWHESRNVLEIQKAEAQEGIQGPSLVINAAKTGLLEEPEIDWRDLTTSYQEILERRPEQLTVTVQQPEGVNKPVKRIRSLIGHMLEKSEISTLIYCPSSQVGDIKFQKDVQSGGRQYYLLDAATEENQINDIRFKHLNYLLHDNDLLRYISVVDVTLPDQYSSKALLKECANICEYLERQGYKAQGTGVHYRFIKTSVNPQHEALEISPIVSWQQSREGFSVFNSSASRLLYYLWGNDSDSSNDRGSNDTIQASNAVFVLLTLHETTKALIRQQEMKKGKTAGDAELVIKEKERVLMGAKNALKGLPITAESAKSQLRQAMKIQALLLHPDKNTGEAQFKEMRAAYEVLLNAIDKGLSWKKLSQLSIAENNISPDEEDADDWRAVRAELHRKYKNSNNYWISEEIEALEGVAGQSDGDYYFVCRTAQEIVEIFHEVAEYHHAAMRAGTHAQGNEWTLAYEGVAEAELRLPQAREKSAIFPSKVTALEYRISDLQSKISRVEQKPEVPSDSYRLNHAKANYTAMDEVLREIVYLCRKNLEILWRQLEEYKPLEMAKQALKDHAASEISYGNTMGSAVQYPVLATAPYIAATPSAATAGPNSDRSQAVEGFASPSNPFKR